MIRQQRDPGSIPPSPRDRTPIDSSDSSEVRQTVAAGSQQADLEIRIVGGPEGERLAELQARVLREVTRWQLAQSNSDDGQQTAA